LILYNFDTISLPVGLQRAQVDLHHEQGDPSDREGGDGPWHGNHATGLKRSEGTKKRRKERNEEKRHWQLKKTEEIINLMRTLMVISDLVIFGHLDEMDGQPQGEKSIKEKKLQKKNAGHN
jgi:hypothetical protein